MKKLLFLLFLSTFLVTVFYLASNNQGEEDRRVLIINGVMEATEVDLAFKIAGRIIQLPVGEGQSVSKGALIARLEVNDIMAQIEAAKAGVELAKAQLELVEAGYRPQELKQALTRINEAEIALGLAEREYERARRLRKAGSISERALDAKRTEYLMAKERLQRAREYYDLIKSGAREEEIEAARARVEAAKKQLEVLKVKLSYSKLMSPIDGIVLSKNAEIGEMVLPGSPVVTIGNIRKMWMKGYINEIYLGRVKLGQKAEIRSDSFPAKRYPGRVMYISSKAEFTPKNVQTREQRVKLVYMIKISVDNPSGELKIGMPVDAELKIAGGPPVSQEKGAGLRKVIDSAVGKVKEVLGF